MRHNKISTVAIGTSIVYTVNQETRNSVRVSVVTSHLISVAMKLDPAMSNFNFDNRQMCIRYVRCHRPSLNCRTFFGVNPLFGVEPRFRS
jgi:tRNA(His) 5'-end guanylyltransferase